MSQEKKQKIAARVKPILKAYNVKGSLRVRNHSTLVLTLRSGTLDFIHDLVDNRMSLLGEVQLDKDKLREKYTLDVNPYWFQEHYTGRSLAFLSEVFEAMKSADWYDRSDAQVDYFDTAYYVDVNIGDWNKPYALTA
jgi:hypothetical protein